MHESQVLVARPAPLADLSGAAAQTAALFCIIHAQAMNHNPEVS